MQLNFMWVYGFLVSERETIPPSGPGCTALFAKPAIPHGYKSRGSSVTTRAPHPKLDRDYAPTADLRCRQTSTKMSMLLRHESELYKAEPLVTQ